MFPGKYKRYVSQYLRPIVYTHIYRYVYLWEGVTKHVRIPRSAIVSIERFGREKSSECWKIHGTISNNRSRRSRRIRTTEMEVVRRTADSWKNISFCFYRVAPLLDFPSAAQNLTISINVRVELVPNLVFYFNEENNPSSYSPPLWKCKFFVIPPPRRWKSFQERFCWKLVM